LIQDELLNDDSIENPDISDRVPEWLRLINEVSEILEKLKGDYTDNPKYSDELKASLVRGMLLNKGGFQSDHFEIDQDEED